MNQGLKILLKKIRHRGPDNSTIISDIPNLLIGHNRLSILDLDSRSNQPFFSRDKRYALFLME